MPSTTIESTFHPQTRALSPNQERRLVDYLDNRFLELTRGYKKRSEPSAHLPTLPDYLNAARHILSMIMQIPPIDPSTALRTAYLLRLTNDVLNAIPGYPHNQKILPVVLDWLDDLDRAWLAVLQCQVWNTEEGRGEDLVVSAEDATSGVKASPVSQTESTRLRSLLVSGSANLEEWLIEGNEDEDAPDVETLLSRLGLQADFDDLFSRTLEYLGGVENPMLDEIRQDVDLGEVE